MEHSIGLMSTKHILKIPRENYSTGDVAFPSPPPPYPPHPPFREFISRPRYETLSLFDPVMKIYGYFSYFLITTASNSFILNRFAGVRRVSTLPGFFLFFFFPSTGSFNAHKRCDARVRDNAGVYVILEIE